MPLEGVEKLERYRPGGFHPIVIGDLLHDRYCVVHKLGFGSYSTTWLARDQADGKYVAIKIAVAENDTRESNIFHQLGVHLEGGETLPGKDTIAPVLDEFVLHGLNGKHRCLVTVPASMNLAEAKDASNIRLFQPSVARAIVAQLIQAVGFLHSRNIVHGDLHLGNILLRLPKDIDSLSPDQFYEQYDHPNPEPVVRLDSQPLPTGVPTHGIMPVWLGKASELVSLSEATIFLTDFGESFLPSVTPRYYSNTPDLLVPPEVHFLPREPLSFSADIWTLACTIWSIIGQRPIFEAFNPSADWMTKEHVEVLGKLPLEWWEAWDARLKWFNEDGVKELGGVGRPWADRFKYSVQEPRLECGMDEMSREENAALFAMLKPMMAFKPWERPTAENIIASDWMRNWALPELGRMRTSWVS
ncbi:hypothetical protein FQN54_004094 [Arachnomyces sp. PD_36]|nr:hypothetical protein FQN54_004094 [Arachnomyces sp. PD_36]